ncbi:class III lanthionine synthetase LanKC [Amycolatopsis sp.]|uniref:class III lanthionine synthetase LanKC n=1 Tax=Amycolatopsis sp. TaxID=37632 RepID=UPI002CAC49FA|nr:class III lanthionine synthetase LanKC [Amycolatopsis sp.]HVV07906.1 class III lanthionine synthetase LanKC [Amycolatopsis sp.]
MDTLYFAFCAADPLFYDKPDGGAGEPYEVPAAPEGWTERDSGPWRSLRPDGVRLPAQGWKIHVSATLDNAERVLETVHAYCLRRRIAFEHLRSRRLLLCANAKYAPRAGSGRFVTLYPVDEDEFAAVLSGLAGELAGEEGPYVLGDLRYGGGPLYVRYGAFAERWPETGEEQVPAIERPDGTLVPDRREPRFSLPDWVSVPDCLAPALAAHDGNGEFPYTMRKALRYSNGGGVYLATRADDGRNAVLKEARPHAGLDGDGTDAVGRLHREHEILGRLTGIAGVPEAYELFALWEHHFLATRELPGRPLTDWLASRYPPAGTAAPPSAVAAYTRDALAILGRISGIVEQVHRRGVVLAGLHPAGILVDDDGRVSLIDFEAASDVRSEDQPGFGAPVGRRGFAIDDHALAVLKLWLFLPLTAMLELDPGKVPGWVRFVTRRFPVPEGFGDGILAELSSRPRAAARREEPEVAVRPRPIVAGILAAATPDRPDRLFPGDIAQFGPGGGVGFAHGAAGVLYALKAAGAGRFPRYERWLLDALARNPLSRPGFWHGRHGVAAVLAEFGYHQRAAELAAGPVDQVTGHGLENGLAGVGLGLLAVPEFLGQATEIGERLAATPAGRAPGGLLQGWSGPALLFIRLFEHTGDERWLAEADRAIGRDLNTCVPAAGASLQVRDDASRAVPYAGTGSAGIALAVTELAAHDPDAPSVAALPLLLRACRIEFTVHSGLMTGRAGLILALAAADDPATGRQLSRLAWHATAFHGGTAFPGDHLLRLSTDLATGSAGVLLALHAARTGEAVLPFLRGRVAAPEP